MSLPAGHARALARLSEALGSVDFVLGGSAMLACRGIAVPVGDLDLVVASEARAEVQTALPDAVDVPSGGPPYSTAWRLATRVHGVDVEILGGFAVAVDGGVLEVPVESDGAVEPVSGVPLASPAPWVLAYAVIDPHKAALLAEHSDPGAMAAARERFVR